MFCHSCVVHSRCPARRAVETVSVGIVPLRRALFLKSGQFSAWAAAAAEMIAAAAIMTCICLFMVMLPPLIIYFGVIILYFLAK